MKKLLCFLCLFLAVHAARAANAITPGTVTLTPTFECIGMVAAYTGDDNANATIAVAYRVDGTSTWKDAYTPYIDRRATVGGFSNTANQRQGRGSIVGLSPGTLYNVRVIWSDSNGGGTTTTNNTTTLNYSNTMPTNGVTKYIDASQASEGSGSAASPYKTITNFLANAVAGETGIVSNGTYVPFTWTKSGNSGNWIVLKAAAGNTPTIGTGAGSENLTLQANFVIIDGFTFTAESILGLNVAAGQHDIFIQNCSFDGHGTGGDAVDGQGAIDVEGTTNVYVLTNYIANLGVTADPDDLHAIQFGGTPADTIVIKGNTITNCSWDGIGGGGNFGPDNGPARNCDIYNNTIKNCKDDGIEMEGSGINLRVWNNRVSCAIEAAGGGGLGIAPIHVGPTYIFRNIISLTNHVALKSGNNGTGPIYIFHNLFSTISSTSGGFAIVGDGDGGSPFAILSTYINNIMEARGNTLYKSVANNTFNYNCHRSTTGQLVSDWNNGTTDYATIGAFRTATGQEANGIEADALVSSYLTGAIPDNSPCVNAGLVLTNFNDASSAWPFSSSAPDIGATENGTAIPTPPSAPQNLSGTAGNAQVTLNWQTPADSGSSAITNYKVYRSTSPGAETLYQTLGVVLSYIDTGVSNGTTYYYKVSAVNAIGESALSNEASATPSAPPPTVALLNPLGIGQ